MTDIKQLIAGYQSWLEQYPDDRFVFCLLSLMFRPIPGSQPVILHRMQGEINRFYSRFLTRTLRNPRKLPSNKLPLLIAIPDAPILHRRENRTPHRDLKLNDGVHYHGLLVMPLRSRIKTGLRTHFADHRYVYCAPPCLLQRIHVEYLTDLKGSFVDYAFKHIKRKTFTSDEIVIFPRSSSELSDK